MPDIKVAFWNVENLFDTTVSEIAADLEFTPAQGWTQAAFDAKVKNLATVIKQLHGGAGPDLFGLCEVENKSVVEALLTEIGRADYQVAHVESPDIRGIDTTLVYSDKVFKKPKAKDIFGHLVHLRFATRDIFEVRLELKGSKTELVVLVNHWPSRRQGQYESEPLRITVAEHAGRIVDEHLKFTRREFIDVKPPLTLADLNRRWNRNVLVMGDLNDEPIHRSVLDYLQGSKDLDHVEEEIKGSGGQPPDVKSYLGKQAFLFNAMWPQFAVPDRGTFYFSGATNSMNLLDQFMVSRGLYFGGQGLQFDPASVAIFNQPPVASPRGRPIAFDRKKLTGYSDHFPITSRIRVL